MMKSYARCITDDGLHASKQATIISMPALTPENWDLRKHNWHETPGENTEDMIQHAKWHLNETWNLVIF